MHGSFGVTNGVALADPSGSFLRFTTVGLGWDIYLGWFHSACSAVDLVLALLLSSAAALMAFIQPSLHPEEWVSNPIFENLNVDIDAGPSTDFSSTSLPFRSREPPTAEEWEEIRPIFTQLYNVENKELKAVIRILESERGFYAT
jgi:hypothetical protein